MFVAITVTDDMVNADISYYKNEAGTLIKVEIPTDGSNPVQFTNTYAASAVSAAPQGSKTLTGRARTAGDSFSFALTAADETTQEAVTNGTVSGAVCASNCTAESILASATSTNVTAESGESQSFEFTQLTFGKAGTYTFNVAEQSGNAGGIIYDTHISTVTYVISDTDASGKHTGRLNVAKVSYSNATATTEADRKVTDAAAFTNAYHATATFAGLTVTKELHNRNAGTARNLYAGEFTFTISGDDEASAQRISAGTFASDRKFSNGYAAGSEAQSATKYGNAVSGMTKLSNLVFNESDVGKTYRFVVKELAQHTNPNTGAVNTKLDSDSTKLTGETATDVKIDGIWFRQWTYLVSVTVSDNGDGTLNVSTSKSVVKGDGSTSTADDITFVNTYETLKSTEIDDTSASASLYKQLSGRDWSDSEKDRFTFTVEKCNYSTNAGSFSDASSIVCTSDGTTLSTLPSPSSSSVTIGKDQVVPTKAGNFAKIGFGSFSFSKPGAYVYKVTEVAGDDTTLTYAANVRYLRFRVEENQMKGVYSVIVTTPGYDAPTATDANDGAAFVNVCKSAERLPLTGGLTTRNFLVGGFVVGLLAVFAGLGIHEWWNKQRRKEQLLE